jgi:hypothetical protein
MRMALEISSLSASLVMFVVGADFPAQAQFMTSYPAIIVVPHRRKIKLSSSPQIGRRRPTN